MEVRTSTTAKGTNRMRVPARAALVFGLAVISVVGLNSTGASAQSWSQTGYPGNVAVQRVIANGATRQISVSPSLIAESPQYAQYAQYVCLTFTQWRIVPAYRPYWSQAASNGRCGWIQANQTSILDVGSNFSGGIGIGYAMTVDVTWQLSNGALIATKHVGFNSTSDYACVTGNCYVNNTNWGGGAYVSFPGY